MSEPVLWARAVLDAKPAGQSGARVSEATIDSLVTGADDGGTTVLQSVTVSFPAGLQGCRWLRSFAAEVLADPTRSWQGQRVALQHTGASPIILGAIDGPALEDLPEDD